MGLLDFVKDAGEKLFGMGKAKAAMQEAAAAPADEAKIKSANDAAAAADAIVAYIGSQNLSATGMVVSFDGATSTVTVYGVAPNQAAMEKIVLCCGNVAGVVAVNNMMSVDWSEPEATYYTVVSGDNLSKISKAQYGDPNHLHFHCVVIDGMFDATATGGIVFHAATGIEANAITDVQACARLRLLRVFVRRGLLPGDDAQAMGQWEHGGGFSVDGSVRIAATDRAGRERLLRYCAHPPFVLDRLRERDGEHLIYEPPKPGPGGSRPQRLTPLALLDRLATLVLPPRIHRHRYFGVLARTAAHRKFPRRARTAGSGRSATVESESERFVVLGRSSTRRRHSGPYAGIHA